MILVTGDTHGQFERIEKICLYEETTKDDILIILGDVCLNYAGGYFDYENKELIESLPITLLCIHGNHEARPETIETYKPVEWNGGWVYVEDRFSSIKFAIDGEIFDLDGQKTIAIGGAYSIDKHIRLGWGEPWWKDEQPSEYIKSYVESQLTKCDWKIDVVLSHTAPLKYEPTYAFLPNIDQEYIDKSTEEWLDTIEDRLEYNKWYCGHYHTEDRIDRIQIMYENYDYF